MKKEREAETLLTPQLKEKIEKLLKTTELLDYQIAKAAGVSRKTVRRLRRKMKLPPKQRKGEIEVDARLAARINDLILASDYNDNQIARLTGAPKRIVGYLRRKMNLPQPMPDNGTKGN